MTVDLNAKATAAISVLQKYINQLSQVKRQNGANVDSIVSQIENLQQQQDDLRTLALEEVENSAENAAALAAVDTAASNLNKEAAVVVTVANALTQVQKVIDCVATLVTTLQKF